MNRVTQQHKNAFKMISDLASSTSDLRIIQLLAELFPAPTDDRLGPIDVIAEGDTYHYAPLSSPSEPVKPEWIGKIVYQLGMPYDFYRPIKEQTNE